MSSKKFVARKKFMKNNALAEEVGADKAYSITARTSKKSYVPTSVKKLLVVADMIRWKDVKEAMELLQHLPQKAAKILYKLVKSAYFNAINNAWLNGDNLYIERIDLWRWMKIKRIRFASRARIHGYVKHRSFVRIVLNKRELDNLHVETSTNEGTSENNEN